MAKQSAKEGTISQALSDLSAISGQLLEISERLERAQKDIAALSVVLRALAPLDGIVKALSQGQGGGDELVAPETGYTSGEKPVTL